MQEIRAWDKKKTLKRKEYREPKSEKWTKTQSCEQETIISGRLDVAKVEAALSCDWARRMALVASVRASIDITSTPSALPALRPSTGQRKRRIPAHRLGTAGKLTNEPTDGRMAKGLGDGARGERRERADTVREEAVATTTTFTRHRVIGGRPFANQVGLTDRPVRRPDGQPRHTAIQIRRPTDDDPSIGRFGPPNSRKISSRPASCTNVFLRELLITSGRIQANVRQNDFHAENTPDQY